MSIILRLVGKNHSLHQCSANFINNHGPVIFKQISRERERKRTWVSVYVCMRDRKRPNYAQVTRRMKRCWQQMFWTKSWQHNLQCWITRNQTWSADLIKHNFVIWFGKFQERIRVKFRKVFNIKWCNND